MFVHAYTNNTSYIFIIVYLRVHNTVNLVAGIVGISHRVAPIIGGIQIDPHEAPILTTYIRTCVEHSGFYSSRKLHQSKLHAGNNTSVSDNQIV